MKDNLVTLAIRTYQRACMIKNVLDENGIETEIHNINPNKPELAVGVRVKIKESDLPRALKIVEDMERSFTDPETKDKQLTQILIPVDFNDIVYKTIDLGFGFANEINAEVVFLYVYFTPAFTITMNNDINTYSISNSELIRRIINNANADIENLSTIIKARITKGEIPELPFHFELKEGVPEEEILDYCKKNNPSLVVMGSHGRKPSEEIVGSVTAEVMESCNVPVFAVPSQMTLNSINQIKKIAFLTNFDQKDLIAIDKIISILGSRKAEIFFVHATDKNEAWDEVLLAGIKTYFSTHYPYLQTNYALIEDSDNPENIEDYLKKMDIDLLAFNTRKRRFLSRLFNPGLTYKLVQQASTPLFVMHIK